MRWRRPRLTRFEAPRRPRPTASSWRKVITPCCRAAIEATSASSVSLLSSMGRQSRQGSRLAPLRGAFCRLARLWRQRQRVVGARFDPLRELLVARRSLRLYVDHVLRRLAGEIHRPRVWLAQGLFGVL